MLSEKLDYCYNYIAQWQYHKLPEILSCEGWVMRKATICSDLDKIMTELDNNETGAYIEIVTPEMSTPPLMEVIHRNL